MGVSSRWGTWIPVNASSVFFLGVGVGVRSEGGEKSPKEHGHKVCRCPLRARPGTSLCCWYPIFFRFQRNNRKTTILGGPTLQRTHPRHQLELFSSAPGGSKSRNRISQRQQFDIGIQAVVGGKVVAKAQTPEPLGSRPDFVALKTPFWGWGVCFAKNNRTKGVPLSGIGVLLG